VTEGSRIDDLEQEQSMAYPHVYVHVPFCARRCSYCDFAIAVRRDVPSRAFVDAIMAELVTRRVSLDAPSLRTIYLGGGTPSKLGGPGVAELIHRIGRHCGVDKFSTLSGYREITVEANPEDVSSEVAAEWAAAGVNRVSLGVQSFHPEVLRWMHRTHGPDAPREAVARLRGAGIDDISVDLIFALPGSLERDWHRDLAEALELRPTHVSLYGLTVESKTPLGRWSARGEVVEAPEDRYADEFLEAHRQLVGAGFDHYEVSNYGLRGHRARHNSAYWSGAAYLGLGPSAHGFDGRSRRWNAPAYVEWLNRVGRGEDPREGHETLTAAERESEAVYLGLRTTDGLGIREDEIKTVTPWIEAGWATLAEGILTLSAQGWLRLDSIAAALTSIRSRS
jgi:oxygen-independent coproporphyrinogen-3 oxidase